MKIRQKILFSCLAACMFLPVQAQLQIIAHRGASAYEVENSLAAFKKAFELGADAIELDIWRTTDDSLVVIHDRETQRLADRNIIIPESDAKTVRSLKLKNGEQIPFLEEALKILPKGKKIVIEIKCCWEEGRAGNVFPMLKNILLRSGRLQDAILIAFNPQRLAEAKKELPHTACYYLSGKRDAEDELLQTCKTLKLDGLNVNYGLLTPSLVKKVKEAGLELWVWTVNNAEVAEEAVKNFHVSGITTDRPDTIREALEP